MGDIVLFTVYFALMGGFLLSGIYRIEYARHASDQDVRDDIARECSSRRPRIVYPLIIHPEEIERRRMRLKSSGRWRASVAMALLAALLITFVFL